MSNASSLPGPRTLKLKLPAGAMVLKPLLKRITDYLLDLSKKTMPWASRLAKAGTDIVLGRTPRISESVLNDKQAAWNFSKEMIENMEPILYRAFADGGGVIIAERNWDVPRALCKAEVLEVLIQSLTRWVKHFRVLCPARTS